MSSTRSDGLVAPGSARPRPARRAARRVVVGAIAAVSASAVLGAGVAGAHVTPQDPEAPSGGYFTTAFKVAHGCEGSPTTKVEIKMGDGVTSVKPQPVAGWTLSTTMRTLDPPVDNHGTAITETVDTVVWEGGSLPDDELQMFWVSMKLPEGDVGSTVAFPVVQTCEQGRTDWIEPMVDGQAEPEHPAPVITLTAAEGDDHDAGVTTTTLAAGEDAAVEVGGATSDDDSSSSNTLAIGGLVLGALGLATGGLALARSGRRA